jgi:hypothetical protein
MSFSNTTGALSGTPNTVASATTYTVTATNAGGSATRIFTLTVTAIVYTVGDIGPSGGRVFYVAATPFACGPTREVTCKYLEAAPSGWNTGNDPQRTWAQGPPVDYQGVTVNNGTSPETARGTALGWGYRNTRAVVLQGNSDPVTSAAALTDSHAVTVSDVVYDDWYLPSKDELNELYAQKASVGGFSAVSYWSSSEFSRNGVEIQNFSNGTQGIVLKADTYYIRPIRAF